MATAEQVAKADQRGALFDELVHLRRVMTEDEMYVAALMNRLRGETPKTLTILIGHLVDQLVTAQDRAA